MVEPGWHFNPKIVGSNPAAVNFVFVQPQLIFKINHSLVDGEKEDASSSDSDSDSDREGDVTQSTGNSAPDSARSVRVLATPAVKRLAMENNVSNYNH